MNRVWISSDDAAAVVQQGYRIVHAPSNYFYLVSNPPSTKYTSLVQRLQLFRTAEEESFTEMTPLGKLHILDMNIDFLGLTMLNSNSWCDPFKTWQEVGSIFFRNNLSN